jgi:hypothetical protein
LIQAEKVTFSHRVPTILQMILTSPAAKDVDLSVEAHHRRIATATWPSKTTH